MEYTYTHETILTYHIAFPSTRTSHRKAQNPDAFLEFMISLFTFVPFSTVGYVHFISLGTRSTLLASIDIVVNILQKLLYLFMNEQLLLNVNVSL